MERFNFKKLNDVKLNEQYQVKISNRFAALKNWVVVVVVDGDVGINRAWESK
jgi:hypothetical protein